MSNTQIINVRGIANSVQMENSRSSGMLNYTRNHNTLHVNTEDPEAEDFKDSLFKLTNLYFEDNPIPKLPTHKLLIEGETDRIVKKQSIAKSKLLHNKPSFKKK